jgi:hypothetical protein
LGGSARPRIILDSGNVTKTRIWHREAGWFAGGISTNISWPGQYNLDDTSKSGWTMFLDSGSDLLRITRAPAGTNPVTPATMLEIGSTGVLVLPNGKIQFPATQSASADANTLDDYEEGTWTPVSLTTNVTVSTLIQNYYTKIGRSVHASCYLNFTNTGGTVGTVTLSGLPFVSVGYGPVSVYYGSNLGGVGTIYIESSSSYALLTINLPNGTTGWMFSFHYITNT